MSPDVRSIADSPSHSPIPSAPSTPGFLPANSDYTISRFSFLFKMPPPCSARQPLRIAARVANFLSSCGRGASAPPPRSGLIDIIL